MHIHHTLALSQVYGQGSFEFIAQGRRLLHEGALDVSEKNKQFAEMAVYLFNDYLVWTSKNGRFKGALPKRMIISKK